MTVTCHFHDPPQEQLSHGTKQDETVCTSAVTWHPLELCSILPRRNGMATSHSGCSEMNMSGTILEVTSFRSISPCNVSIFLYIFSNSLSYLTDTSISRLTVQHKL